MKPCAYLVCGICLLGISLQMVGCGGPPGVRSVSTELAADAAKRAYEANAPKGDKPEARAEYSPMTEYFDLVNLSGSDWNNVEVWVNQDYVVFVPTITKGYDYHLKFDRFFDQNGHRFDTHGGKYPVQSLQIYRGGKMYDVPLTLD